MTFTFPGATLSCSAMGGLSRIQTRFAPSQPARSDPVVTVKLLRQLYKSTLLRYSLKRGEIPEDERVDVDPESHMLAALDALFAPHLKNYHWWRPMTDALILPVYLLRASQLDQLDECLQYLLGSPMGRELTLATMTWASWQAICLDDRSETKHLFEGLAETQGKHRRAQYPIVLATLALLEWSLPMLHVVMRHFPSALTTLDIATFATSGYPRVFSSMLSLLGSSPSLPDSVDRIMDMHEWLEVHSGQRLVSPLASLCRPRTPLQYLEQVLIDIDIPRLRMAEQEHNEALSTAERKGIAECIGTVGSVELLSLVLNHGFALGLVEWVLLVTCDVQKWWVVLQQHVESKDEQCNVAFSGFWHATQPHHLPAFSHIWKPHSHSIRPCTHASCVASPPSFSLSGMPETHRCPFTSSIAFTRLASPNSHRLSPPSS
ncbi:hypothetical protein BCR44DRAFT_1156830 [Catenaria anguillulae PL171]|uniref:Uncharacterized protein n=1 Tax=Catenaria anguillulae PL171 TaxID=765915 RepID=A0A1Y2HI85_9FUNG|nr:hypothetical protein BCR44DRAFT_1156830 [Catenaria anguillulae PL171]